MTQLTGRPPTQTTPTRLDWSRAIVADPAPCTACGQPALLRHPETGQPHHKVCDEPAGLDTTVEPPAILPCRFCGSPASLRGPEGEPEHWSCRTAEERRKTTG